MTTGIKKNLYLVLTASMLTGIMSIAKGSQDMARLLRFLSM